MSDFQEENFAEALERLFLVIQRWTILTNRFQPSLVSHLNEFFECTYPHPRGNLPSASWRLGERRPDVTWVARFCLDSELRGQILREKFLVYFSTTFQLSSFTQLVACSVDNRVPLKVTCLNWVLMLILLSLFLTIFMFGVNWVATYLPRFYELGSFFLFSRLQST